MVELIIWMAFGGAFFFFTLAGYKLCTGGWERYESTYAKGAEKTLEAAWISVPPVVVVYLSIASGLATYLFFSAIAGNPWLGIPFGGLGMLLPRILLWIIKRRRDRKFGFQVVDALANMSNSMKAGLSLPQAIELIARDMDNPIRQEFGLVAAEMRVGLPIEEALHNLVERMPSQDLELVVSSIDIAKEVGGNLTEVLETIAGTIRERHRIEGKIKALTAQGRLQGLVMTFLPIAAAVYLYYFQPSYFGPMVTSLLGWVILGATGLWMVIGAFFIFKIVNIDV